MRGTCIKPCCTSQASSQSWLTSTTISSVAIVYRLHLFVGSGAPKSTSGGDFWFMKYFWRRCREWWDGSDYTMKAQITGAITRKEIEMTTLSSYLLFDGNCRQAMEFYKSCLGGEL